MNASRRGFFGIAAGAAAAAPAAAKSVAAVVERAGGGNQLMSAAYAEKAYGATFSGCPTPPENYDPLTALQNELRYLVRERAESAERHALRQEGGGNTRLAGINYADSLRSVSMVNRTRIARETEIRLDHLQSIYWLDEAIEKKKNELKSKFGILADIAELMR